MEAEDAERDRCEQIYLKLSSANQWLAKNTKRIVKNAKRKQTKLKFTGLQMAASLKSEIQTLLRLMSRLKSFLRIILNCYIFILDNFFKPFNYWLIVSLYIFRFLLPY